MVHVATSEHIRNVALFFRASVLESPLRDSWWDKGPNQGFDRRIKDTEMLNHSSEHAVAARFSISV